MLSPLIRTLQEVINAPPGAVEIRDIVTASLRRSGRDDVAGGAREKGLALVLLLLLEARFSA